MAGAVVSVKTGVMNSVLGKLNTLIVEEQNQLQGLRRDMVFLKDELTSMNSALVKLAEEEDADVMVREWMNQVREMAYDIEDCIDNFMRSLYEDADAAKIGPIRKAAKKLKALRLRHQTASQIQELKARVVQASERRTRYHLDASASGHQHDQTSAAASCRSSYGTIEFDPTLPEHDAAAAASFLVGIDGPRDDLIERLTSGGQKQIKVVSIVGEGGSGKTTLANAVYHKLQGQFESCAFVSMSQKPDMGKILRNMLSQIGKKEFTDTEAWDEERLMNESRGLLMDKRYLIIIDDVWSTLAWRTLKCALPENNCGSRILTTTRFNAVAHSCCYTNQDHVFEMKFLSELEARKLFFGRTFGTEDGCPPDLEQVSSDILKITRGMPLLINIMAGLLATKSSTKEQWEWVRDSIGPKVAKNPGIDAVRSLLYFSYNDLPHYLKTCLMYLGMFPEDHVIHRHELVYRWIAEGFITEESSQSLAEVGGYYFDELVNRGMVQPVNIQYDGRAHTCRVHDLVLEFIVSKAAKENFVTTLGEQNHLYGLQNKIRRLSLDYGSQEDTVRPSKMTVSHIRSLTIFGTTEHVPTLADFRALRVLHVESLGGSISHSLHNIDKLFHLRYLRLQTTTPVELPEEIGNLPNLETLDLRRAHVRQLPRRLFRLRQLTHLFVHNVELPTSIKYLTSLQELSCIKVFNNSASYLDELGNLTKLRNLGLNWCVDNPSGDMKTYSHNFVSSLNKLCRHNLQSLYIGSDVGSSFDFLLDSWSPPPHLLQKFDMSTDYYFSTIPICLISLANLLYLNINVSQVGEEVVHSLGHLPALLFLSLSIKSVSLEQRLVIKGGAFQCLKHFIFTSRSNWTGMIFEQGAMQKLEKLKLVFNAQGLSVYSGSDFGIVHLISLKHIHVEINCCGARAWEVEIAESSIREATYLVLSNLTLDLQKLNEQSMVEVEREITIGDEEELDQNEVEREITIGNEEEEYQNEVEREITIGNEEEEYQNEGDNNAKHEELVEEEMPKAS